MEIPKKMAFDQINKLHTKVQNYFTKKYMGTCTYLNERARRKKERERAMHTIFKCR